MALPTLTGSEKQIRWAKSIRTDRLSRWKSSDPIVFQRVEPALNSETSASWWITYREKELGEVLKYVQAGGGSAGTATVKPSIRKDTSKAPKASPPPLSFEKKTYVASGDDGGITRFVGELRDAATGELVVDLECPF